MRSSFASVAWRTPCEELRPEMVASRFLAEPRTLTKTFACRRSGLVSTPVIVTNPIRGSFSSPRDSDRTWRTDSFTRRIRLVVKRDHFPVDPRERERLRGEEALG